MASHECKAIEKCIKDLLYNSTAISTENSFPSDHSPFHAQNDENSQMFNTRHLASDVEEHAYLTNITGIPFEDVTNPVDKQDESQFSSELIDLNVLKTFADQHLNDVNLTSSMSLTCDKSPLPHPEYDESCVKPDVEKVSNDINPEISVLLSNISKEIQKSPHFRSMPENPFSQFIKSPMKRPHNDKAERNQKNLEWKKELKKQKKLKRKSQKEQSLQRNTNQKEAPKIEPDKTAIQAEINKLRVKLQAPSKKTENNSSEKDVTKNPSTSAEVSKVIKLKTEALPSSWREYSIVKKANFHFICDVCEYNSTDEAGIVKHLKLSTHKEKKQVKLEEIYLAHLPDPLSPQVEAITDLILYQAAHFGLKDYDLAQRKIVADNLKQLIKENLPSCSIELIGSSLSQFGHKYSHVDFILKVPSDINAADALANAYELLLKVKGFKILRIWTRKLKKKNLAPGYAHVFNLFKRKIPQVQFVDIASDLPCTLILDNGTAFQLAKLLSTYAKLDDRVPVLGTVLRNWAHVCTIDNQDAGTLPSFAYALLLVYFLQRTEPPVLPVLHEEKNYEGSAKFLDNYVEEKRWKSQNTDPIGLLWINFFRFYNFVYKPGEDVICIRSFKTVSCKEKNWGTKFYAIEDPFVRRNIAYVIPTQQVYRYIQNCFLRTYRHFAFPRVNYGTLNVIAKGIDPLKDGTFEIPSLDESLAKEETHEENEASDNSLDTIDPFEDHDPDIPIDLLISTMTQMELDPKDPNTKENEIEPNEDSEQQTEKTTETDPSADANAEADQDPTKESSPKKTPKPKFVSLKEYYLWEENDKSASKMDYNYEFKKKVFRGEKNVPLFCKSCYGKGHLKDACPAEELPPTFPLPEMTPSFLKLIDKICVSVMYENMPSTQELRCRNSDMLEIQAYIREVFPNATLSLFGSFCNGFGFKRSDMDFCLTFDDKENGKDLDGSDIFKKIAAKLAKHPKLTNVLSIASAKVPIVKFVHKDSELDGDISLYNTLAQHNTKMLDAYSKIDERVKILGYVLKYFAKVLKICDASRGSLSSYAYVLMVIFFLQQRNPPVIPVLQELCNEKKSVFMVEGWNAWFFEDIDQLKEAWPDHGKNTETVGELWLGLLDFYAREFNLKEYVVSIRQREPLTRFRKLWISEQIAIEDPFDLNHNLGAGLSRKMNSFILRAFIRGRERFGTPLSLDRMSSITNNELNYLFDRRFLTDGQEPPNDRGCRSCGKIGHIARDCTEKVELRRDNRNMRQRDMKPLSKAPHNNRYGQQRERQNYRNQQPNRRAEPLIKNFPPLMPPINPNLKIDPQRLPLALGVPSHRFPAPGFQANPPPGFPSNPPPGFSTSLPQSQNLLNYMAPFANQRPLMTQPFPINMTKLTESPPKQFAASPPKQHNRPIQNIPNYPPQQDWGGNRPGFIQHHPEQNYASHGQNRNLHYPIRNSRPLNHQPNQQNRPRTGSDPNHYNGPYQQRW